jgi:hypothetical protein
MTCNHDFMGWPHEHPLKHEVPCYPFTVEIPIPKSQEQACGDPRQWPPLHVSRNCLLWHKKKKENAHIKRKLLNVSQDDSGEQCHVAYKPLVLFYSFLLRYRSPSLSFIFIMPQLSFLLIVTYSYICKTGSNHVHYSYALMLILSSIICL